MVNLEFEARLTTVRDSELDITYGLEKMLSEGPVLAAWLGVLR